METGKKIVFEGVDNTSKASDSAKRSITGLHDANIKGLKDTNVLLKENISLLEKQKSLITSIAGQGQSGPAQNVIGQLTQKLFQTPDRVNPEHLRSFSKVLESSHLTGDSKGLSEKLIQKIQELIDNDKLQHRETSQHHLKDDAETKKIMTGPLAFLGGKAAEHKTLEKIEKLNEISIKKFGHKDGGGGPPGGGPPSDGSSKGDRIDMPHSITDVIENGMSRALKFIGLGAAAGGIIGLGKAIFDNFAKVKSIMASASPSSLMHFIATATTLASSKGSIEPTLSKSNWVNSLNLPL